MKIWKVVHNEIEIDMCVFTFASTCMCICCNINKYGDMYTSTSIDNDN